MGAISRALANSDPFTAYLLVQEATEEIGLEAGSAGKILLALIRTQSNWKPVDETGD